MRKYYRVKEERKILHTIKRRKANWIGHNWRRNCLPKHVIEGNIKYGIVVTIRQRTRRKVLLYNRVEKGYWKLKEDALGRTVWRTGCGSVCGPVGRQTA
jgi:hypothetical protein